MASHTIIYVALLEEGTQAWRPVTAAVLGKDVFLIHGPVPEGELWQFEPGCSVRCEQYVFSDGMQGLVAVDGISA
jgi:hypothetical protein